MRRGVYLEKLHYKNSKFTVTHIPRMAVMMVVRWLLELGCGVGMAFYTRAGGIVF